MKRPPPNTCPRCTHRLLAPTEDEHVCRPHTIQVLHGQLLVRCLTRHCGTWCPAPVRLLEVLRLVVAEETPCWKD
jgi:hypothetical protein